MWKKSLNEVLKEEGDLIYTFKGSSMLPLLIEKEDLVHIKKCDNYELFDVVMFQSSRKTFILHRIIDITDGIYSIIGDNSARVDKKTKGEILGKMVGYYKGTRYVDIKDKEYQDYLKKYIYPKKNGFKELANNSATYFANRLINPIREIVNVILNPSYKVDTSSFEVLRPFEVQRLIGIVHTKKVAHILGYILENTHIESLEPYKNDLLKIYELSKLRYIRIEQAKTEISKTFNEENINHMFLKGAISRELYPNKYFRWSNDIDLYVSPDDFEKAKKVLVKKLSYKYFSTSQHHVDYISEKYKLNIELHFRIDDNIPAELVSMFSNPFVDATVDENNPYLYYQNIDKFYAYHLIHMIRHSFNGEFWIPMLTDTILLNKNYKFDPNIVKQIMLETFNEKFNNICKFMQDKSYPTTEEERAYLYHILTSGSSSYGALSKNAQSNKAKYILRRFFPEFEEFKYSYPVLLKAPFLAPVFYTTRLVTRVFDPRKIKAGKEQLREYEDAKKEDLDVLTNIGLGEYIVGLYKK